MSHTSLVNAIHNQEAIIQAVIHGSKAPHISANSERMIQCIVLAVLEVQASQKKISSSSGMIEMDGYGRFCRDRPLKLWVLSGQALRDIPKMKGMIGRDAIPIHPKYYKDYAFLKDQAQDMDWSLLSPGRIEMGEVRVLLYQCR